MKFPGIGPRQAARFAFYILGAGAGNAHSLADALRILHNSVGFCETCYVAIERKNEAGEKILCDVCRNKNREPSQIIVIEKEADRMNIEKTGKFSGLYHVLGGTIDPLDSTAPARLHIKELFSRAQLLKEKSGNVEIVLATNATTEGDATALYLERVLRPLEISITRLGRGLTTGTELEYSDEMTIVNALNNRK